MRGSPASVGGIPEFSTADQVIHVVKNGRDDFQTINGSGDPFGNHYATPRAAANSLRPPMMWMQRHNPPLQLPGNDIVANTSNPSTVNNAPTATNLIQMAISRRDELKACVASQLEEIASLDKIINAAGGPVAKPPVSPSNIIKSRRGRPFGAVSKESIETVEMASLILENEPAPNKNPGSKLRGIGGSRSE